MVVINLLRTTPTMFADRLREASKHAAQLAADPLNQLDDNPFIAREWLIVSQILWVAARDLEQRLLLLFGHG